MTPRVSGLIMEVNGLRGVCIMLVMLGHALGNTFFFLLPVMDFLFIVSGCFVTRIFVEIGFSFRGYVSFYARRGIRTWPMYYFVVVSVLAFDMVLVAFGRGHPVTLEQLLKLLTFTQFASETFGIHDTVLPTLAHTWSLAIEEQFYVVWSVVGLALAFSPRLGCILLMVVTAFSIVFRAFGGWHNVLAGRLDSFAAGAFLILLFSSDLPLPVRLRRDFNWSRIFGWLSCISLLIYFVVVIPGFAYRHDQEKLIDFSDHAAMQLSGKVLMLAISGYVLSNVGAPHLRFLCAKWLGLIGLLSYQIYLVHVPLMYYGSVALKELVGLNYKLGAGLMAVVSVLVAWFWFVHVDKRLAPLRNYFSYPSARRSELGGN